MIKNEFQYKLTNKVGDLESGNICAANYSSAKKILKVRYPGYTDLKLSASSSILNRAHRGWSII